MLHAQLGQLETARSMLQALAQETPTARTYNNLGYVLYLQGEYAQAASVLRQSLQLDNGQQPARANLDLAIAALARSVGTVDAVDARKPSRPTWRRRRASGAGQPPAADAIAAEYLHAELARRSRGGARRLAGPGKTGGQRRRQPCHGWKSSTAMA